jgi:hypothetical protein
VVVEGSAFVAAALGGMTPAQLGADLIRFDQLGGGLNYGRWPLAANGESLFWAGMNKGKRSLQVDLHFERGRELVTACIAAAAGFLTNFPATAGCPTTRCAGAAGTWSWSWYRQMGRQLRSLTTPSTRRPGSCARPARAAAPSRSGRSPRGVSRCHARQPHPQVKAFKVLPVFWAPESGELTPTLKLKRRGTAEKYADEIDALYA